MDKNTENARDTFRIKQMAAIADIAIYTAVALSRLPAELGPIVGAIAAGGVIASGAAQAGIVMAQTPPAHMGAIGQGDLLAPDEGFGRRILDGEAILDRASVNRLGGEQGVRGLMCGDNRQTTTTIVVPWKHLDRELGRSARQNSRFSRAMRRAATVTDGRRGW